MSTLETNAIGKYSGNNVSVDDSLNLKSYTTTQRDALTSATGDTIFNSTTSKVEYYDGSSWVETGGDGLISIQYLVIAGGGAGGTGESASAGGAGGGGGAGGYRNSYATETSGGNSSTEQPFRINPDGSTTYTITIGAGGAGVSGYDVNGSFGNNSLFGTILSFGGGGAGAGSSSGGSGGSGGGCGADISQQQTSGTAPIKDGGMGTPSQGFDGGTTVYRKGGGGGGAGQVANTTDVNGGNGLASSITGSAVTRAGGGAGGTGANVDTQATGGTGGGGNGGSRGVSAVAGTVNTGSGAGGCGSSGSVYAGTGFSGGSGIVILRYATADATISVGAGLTSSSATDGTDTVVTFTAGTGTVTFS